jgi:hypothetical protein
MKPDKASSWYGAARRLWFTLWNAGLEFLAAGPVLLGIASFLHDSDTAVWSWLLGLTVFPVMAALFAVTPFLRWSGMQVVCNALTIAAWSWYSQGLSVPALVMAAAGIISAYRASQLAGDKDQGQYLHIIMWMGFATCAPAAFFTHRIEAMGDYSGLLTFMAVTLFVASLVISNSSSMSRGTFGSKNTSESGRAIRRFNRLLVLGIGLPVFALSFWGMMDGAVRRAALWLLKGIGLLMPDGGEEPEQQPTMPPETRGSEFPFDNSGHSSIIWIILDYILIAGFIVGAILFTYFILKRLSKRFPGWLRSALAWLTRYRSGGLDEDEGYVDVVTSTRDNKALSKGGPWKRLKRLFQGEPGTRWEDMGTNRERIRFLYAQAVRRSIRSGLQWKPQWTPTETSAEASKLTEAAKSLDSELCASYERARYGGREPDDAETARLRAKAGGH